MRPFNTIYEDRSSRQAITNIHDISPDETAATEFITLQQAKDQCRVTFTDDDDLITALITECRRVVENFCNISLVTKTVTVLGDFITDIELPNGPVASFTSLTDKDGIVVDPGAYKIYGKDFKRLHLTVRRWWNATAIYVAGPGATPVDPQLVGAILQEIAFRYENRGEGEQARNNVNPGVCNAAEVLAQPFKRMAWQ